MKHFCIWLPKGMIGSLRAIAKRDNDGDLDDMVIKAFYNLIASSNANSAAEYPRSPYSVFPVPQQWP